MRQIFFTIDLIDMATIDNDSDYKPPTKRFRDWIREHIVPINNLVLISGSLVAVCDFFSPLSLSFNRTIYSGTAVLALILALAAVFPTLVDKALVSCGYQIRRTDAIPLWQRPVWIFAVTLLTIFSTLGFASVAKASEGGWFASKFASVRTAQEFLSVVRQDIAQVKSGVDAANGKLDKLIGDTSDPQKELVSRGYSVNGSGLINAIRNGDKRAVGLLVKSGVIVDWEAPLAALLNGAQPWDGELAAMLPRRIFVNQAACKHGYLLMYQMKPPVKERIDTFKRLCDPAPIVSAIEQAINDGEAKVPMNDFQKELLAVRISNLALLKK